MTHTPSEAQRDIANYWNMMQERIAELTAERDALQQVIDRLTRDEAET